MAQQVQRIGGQLLTANLERDLADLAFDTDLLVVKRNGTLGVNTATTPRDLTINGTLKVASGTSDPDIIFGNSLTVGDLTISTEGASRATGNITLETTHPNGYIRMGGLGSLEFAVKDNGVIETINTNADIGFRPTYLAGMTEAWNYGQLYGEYWYPGVKDSAQAPDNDCDRIYADAVLVAQRGAPFTQAELDAFDFDGDGDVQIDDALDILAMNSQFINGQYFPATNAISEHSNPEGFKAYVEANYPRSVPRDFQIQTGGKLHITGNLHATGNITYGGTDLTVGDDSTDNARFLADFASNLVPDLTDYYVIGRDDDSTGPDEGKRFDLHVKTMDVGYVRTKNIVYQGIELTKNTGNIYVSTNNGSDLNRGTHPGGPFATLGKALSIAQPGDNIFIYAGQYQEDFPLVVPADVTIQGDSIRSVEIYPTTETQSNNAFEFQSGSNIENITIKDFYYDDVNDKGYAFAFADDYDAGFRSPYIRNVTVITTGTATSASDPRGYASGDAGRGALIDGRNVNENSSAATMLFQSATFITPGVDCIVMRNGVRVEWLNSFTYFAARGMVATQGEQGRLLADSTRRYGAEVRSIGSANVYGNIGVQADGTDCIFYLINHNFAYIGAGKDATNDYSLSIEANKTIATNSAKIYYTGQDEQGNFNVGDYFKVDQVNGRVSFDIESIFASDSVVRIIGEDTEVYIDATRLNSGNIVVSNNTIFSTVEDINLTANTDFINFLTDTNISGDIDIIGDITIGGTVIGIGNESTDTVDFNVRLSQDLIPGGSEAHKIGDLGKTWRTTYINEANINDITISPNSISTTVSNADLEFRSNNDGKVYFENVELKSNIVASKFDRAGEFTILETDESSLAIFDSFESLAQYFPESVEVYGIPVMRTAAASREALLHTANLLAGYLDNDYDGIVDDATMYAEFINGDKGIVVFANSADETVINAALGSWKARTTSVYENEMNNFQGDSVGGNRDVTLERLLRYFLIKQGFSVAYASTLGYVRPTTLTVAMDNARGGFQAGGIAGYNYPPFAWYTDPTGLTYQNLTYEYLYFALSTYAGSNTWRDADIEDIWKLATPTNLASTDSIIVSIIESGDYNFPTTEPVLDYWDAVTSNIGGTTRDLVIETDNLDIDATSHLMLNKGTSAERPLGTGGLRFNTDFQTFEGVVGGGSVSLEGIYSTDRKTYIDLSNNEYNFVTDNISRARLNGFGLFADQFTSDNKFKIDGNVVTSAETNGKVYLKSTSLEKKINAQPNPQIVNSPAKFGKSLFLDDDSSTMYLQVDTNTDFGFGTEDFTVEGWIYKEADTGQENIFDFRTTATDNAVTIGVQAGNLPFVYVNGAYEIQSATALTLLFWNHIAYVRSGTTGTLYLNGTSVGSWTDNTDYGTTKPLILGADYTGSTEFWIGYFDSFKVSKGIARYITNFTAPTAEFSTDEKTVLLLNFNDAQGQIKDVSPGKTIIEDLTFTGGRLKDTTGASIFSFNLTNTKGEAYLKIDNVSGIVTPYGDDSERPLNPEVGHLRYNSQRQYLEVWTGTQWQISIGSVESLEVADVEELNFLWNVILD